VSGRCRSTDEEKTRVPGLHHSHQYLQVYGFARTTVRLCFSCSTPGVGASPEDEARVELQRSLRAWLELQADVNALIDSTTAPEKGVSVR